MHLKPHPLPSPISGREAENVSTGQRGLGGVEAYQALNEQLGGRGLTLFIHSKKNFRGVVQRPCLILCSYMSGQATSGGRSRAAKKRWK